MAEANGEMEWRFPVVTPLEINVRSQLSELVNNLALAIAGCEVNGRSTIDTCSVYQARVFCQQITQSDNLAATGRVTHGHETQGKFEGQVITVVRNGIGVFVIGGVYTVQHQ